MVSFTCNLVHCTALQEIYKSSSFSGLWLTVEGSFSKISSSFSIAIVPCTTLVNGIYALLSHIPRSVVTYYGLGLYRFFFTLRRMHIPLCLWKQVCLIVWPVICWPSNRHLRWTNAFLLHEISATHKLILLTLAGRDAETNTFITIQRLLLKAFSPFKPLIPPPAAVLINSTSAEFSILLWLVEHGKPPHSFSLA